MAQPTTLTTVLIGTNGDAEYLAAVQTIALPGVEFGFLHDDAGWHLIGVAAIPACPKCGGSGVNADLTVAGIHGTENPTCSKCEGSGADGPAAPIILSADREIPEGLAASALPHGPVAAMLDDALEAQVKAAAAQHG